MKKIIYRTVFIISLYIGFCFSLNALPYFNPVFNPFAFLLVSGESMEPNLKDGDLILVRAYRSGSDRLKKGMIINFRDEDIKGNKIITAHRIVEIKEDGVVTCGDNNGPYKDGLIKFDDIESVYLNRLPGYYLGVGQTKKFLILLSDSLTEKIFIFPVYFYQIFFLLLLFICMAMKRKKTEGLKAKV